MATARWQRHRPRPVDTAGELGRETLVEQGRDRDTHESGVGDVGVAHGIGETRRLERDMEALGAERVERGKIEALQDVEQYQRGQALGVGGQFQHVEPAVIRGDRRDELATMAAKSSADKKEPRAARVATMSSAIGPA